MTKKTRKSQLPSIPRTQDAQTRQFLDAAKQAIEVAEGQRGDPLDATLTRRDLAELGMAQIKKRASKAGAGASVSDILDPDDPPEDLTEPPKPSNLKAQGTATRVIISWDRPRYTNHSHAEVFRSEESNFEQAHQIGTQAARMHVDSVGNGFDGYYWVRFVSEQGVKGKIAGPVHAETMPDIEYLMERLTGQITEAQLYQDLNNKIDRVEELDEKADKEALEDLIDSLDENWYVHVGGYDASGSPLIGGFGIGIDQDQGVVDFGVMANRFWVGQPGASYGSNKPMPFIIEGGSVYMDEAFIREASITEAKIAEAAIDNIVSYSIEASKAYISDLDVWDLTVENRIESAGAPSVNGGFVIRREGSIEVYDEEGNLRVQIGRLS